MMDVAKAAGVSQTTVSLVLNGVPGIRISTAARERVLAAAAALRYRVGPRGAGKLRVIGFLADELSTSPFAVLSADAARDAALEANAMLVVAACRGDPALEAAMLELWESQHVTDVIYSRIFTCRADPPPQLARHRSVLLNCYDAAGAYPAVVPSERRGAAAATRHLLQAGHRRVALINGEPWMEAARDRAAGYRHALRSFGIGIDPALICEGDWTVVSGRTGAQRLMSLPRPPTAIFCANDPMAAGACEVLRGLGLRIPEDVSVVGYDDQPLARTLIPPLTTVDLPHAEMGRFAVAGLLAPQPAPPGKTSLPCRVVQRSSVAAPQLASPQMEIPAKRRGQPPTAAGL